MVTGGGQPEPQQSLQELHNIGAFTPWQGCDAPARHLEHVGEGQSGQGFFLESVVTTAVGQGLSDVTDT